MLFLCDHATALYIPPPPTPAGDGWANETMEWYLRPETLFGSKMDGYLQAARRAQKKAAPASAGGGFRRWKPERFEGGED